MENSLSKVKKTDIGEIVNELKFILENDWEESKFCLFVMKDDII